MSGDYGSDVPRRLTKLVDHRLNLGHKPTVRLLATRERKTHSADGHGVRDPKVDGALDRNLVKCNKERLWKENQASMHRCRRQR